MAVSDARSSNGPLVSSTVEELGRLIVRGDVAPGKAMPVEQKICDQLGVSRIVVREAVKMLSGKNMIRSARRAGTIVEPFEDWNLLDPQLLGWMLLESDKRGPLLNALTELRAIIEPEAAALAAERASTSQIMRLFEVYRLMERHVDDKTLAVEHDVAFHLTLLEASGNVLLRTFAEPFGQLLKANFDLSIQVDQAFIRNLSKHYDIACAIQDRDAALARNLSAELMEKNEADLNEYRRKSPGL